MLTFACRVLALLCCSAVASAAAAAYPDKPVRLVVPFAPGGTNDTLGRIIGEKMSARLGQPFVIDNRAGANSIIGCEIVARATPDGHTLIIVAAGFAVNPGLVRKLPYDTVRDFAPIGLVASGHYLMVVHPSVPAKTAGEFIAWAKTKPGQVNYASTGNGSPPHLAAELFRTMAGIDIQHVPYKGGGAVMPDLLAGRVSMFFGSMPTLRAHLASGKIRAIAITAKERAPALPDVPTVAESGVPSYEVSGWYGVLGPGRMPRAIVSTLNTTLRQVLEDPATRALFATQGVDPMPRSADEFAAFIVSEIAKWGKVVRAAGIKPE